MLWSRHAGVILICLSGLGLSAKAENYESIGQLIQSIDGMNNHGVGNTVCPCDPPLQRISTPPKPAARFQKVEDQVGEQIDISVLTEEEALALFRLLKREQLGLRNDAVCAQRAHLMSLVMEDQGVISGKLFAKPGWFGSIVPDIEGRNLRWKYHVAPFLFVEKDGKVEQWVFDPFLFDRPVPRTQWESKLSSNPDSSLGKVQTTRRFVYRPSHVHDSPTGYNPSEIMETRDILSRANSRNFTR